ncbi:hypothetical protein GGX14DRAFT_652879 [Mycena pura]|uniref:Peptidase M20 dimerisation domain-containing protein n=1 Tax=Mycena pura TaxID=153505 RepID=A0AAD6V8N8_9AGAR|nr:hypothetical protein GGX14DRAFT_652879 [Mycena pura]
MHISTQWQNWWLPNCIKKPRADLHKRAGVGHESCTYHFTHDGVDERWLLSHDHAPSAPSTEKLLNVVHQVVVNARVVKAIAANRNDIYRPEVMQTIEDEIDMLGPRLVDLSMQIHEKAELKFHENFAHDTLSDFMAAQGFKVTKNYKSDVPSATETPKFMKTAWRAAFTHIPKQLGASAVRTLGVNSEMDALPIPKGQVTHACGHNLIAIGGVAVALAVKKALQQHDVAGSVVLLGTPAEEGGHGKVRLLDADGYKGIDACVMCHPGSGPQHSVVTGSSLAIQAIRVEFTGKPAHAALQPWEGVNAQDAVMLSYSAISMLRQQIRPDLRVHGVVQYDKEPLPANVIPADMAMVWNIRAPTKADLEGLRARVVKCFEGAAIATGCTANIVCKPPVLNLNQNSVLAKEFAHIATVRCGMTAAEADENGAFSTDFGNVSYALPALHPGYAVPTVPNGGNHTAEFAAAAGTPEAHAETLKVAKALSLLGFRVLDDDGFFKDVKDQFTATAK